MLPELVDMMGFNGVLGVLVGLSGESTRIGELGFSSSDSVSALIGDSGFWVSGSAFAFPLSEVDTLGGAGVEVAGVVGAVTGGVSFFGRSLLSVLPIRREDDAELLGGGLVMG
jgi:hypothetical protein